MHRFTWFFMVIILAQPVRSQSISARFSTSIYSWERSPTDTTTQDHVRLYQTAQFTVGQLASNRLSFHLYTQISQDLVESSEDDPIPRLYNAYLQWRERRGFLEKIKIGRQRVYSGVAYGTIDGIDATLRIGKKVRLGGFAGFLVPFTNSIEIDDWKVSHTFGIRLQSKNFLGSKILISFMQRNRRPVNYSAPGRFTQKILQFESLEQRLAGIDIFRNFDNKINLYGRLDYDLLQKRVQRGQLELRYEPSVRWELAGEFFHRAPLVEYNSIFSVFDFSTTQELDVRVNYRLQKDWQVMGKLGLVFYDGDQTQRILLGLRFRYGFIAYNFRHGYGGQNNGVTASINYPFTPKIGFMISSGVARYSLFNTEMPQYTSLTGSVGINYRPYKYFSLDILGQGVRNRFYDNDFRIFMRANYWVFAKSK
ncbi:MAG: hypothetical protein D6813_15475 [Calditrichaeota bacterium]|nr:MAG: hypothetical protein D6813_15475 [Calditrichota bacterium]